MATKMAGVKRLVEKEKSAKILNVERHTYVQHLIIQ